MNSKIMLFPVLASGAASAALLQEPYEAPENSWISLTGTVTDTATEQFTIAYDGGSILVEMDDWDWYDEADMISEGERVTVYGRIDDGLYERRSIEADSVFVQEHSTFFYANDADEEGDYLSYPHFVHGYAVPEGTWLTVSGKVKEVDGREFTLDTGFRDIQIDTDEMLYNPMDDEGYQKVRKGHRVSVTGTFDHGFFEADEITANTIVTLSRDKTKKTSSKSTSDSKNSG